MGKSCGAVRSRVDGLSYPSALLGTGISAGKTLQLIEETFVVAEIRRAGFVLDGEGAFMRSAGDTRDKSSNQPGSNKFVLRFVKPR